MRYLTYIVLMILSISKFSSGYSSFPPSNPFQVLEAFGMREKDLFNSPRVTMGESKYHGESPIYYIKLPPMPYLFDVHNTISDSVPNTNSFLQLDVDFINNGKPEQIYHWNYKPNIGIKNPPVKAPSIQGAEFQSIAMPPEIPLIANKIMKASQDQEKLLAAVTKPFISLKKNFFYNGRPSAVYIWKPEQPKTVSRFTHPYFKHFNY